MANRIKGITVEINGDTTKLSKALEGVNKNMPLPFLAFPMRLGSKNDA